MLVDTYGKVMGEVVGLNVSYGEGEGGLGVKELELVQDDRRANVVHRSWPKQVSVDLIPISIDSGDFRAFAVKPVADVGCNNSTKIPGPYHYQPP